MVKLLKRFTNIFILSNREIFLSSVLLLVFNIIDAVSTSVLIELDLGREVNPLMDYLLEIHPLLFVFVKMFLIMALCMHIIFEGAKFKDRKIFGISLLAMVSLYALVAGMHTGYQVILYYLMFS